VASAAEASTSPPSSDETSKVRGDGRDESRRRSKRRQSL